MKEILTNYNGDTYIIKSKYDYDLYAIKLNKDKEIERLNNIIEDLKAILKSKGYEVMICSDIDNKGSDNK